jgi:hypothetical protein
MSALPCFLITLVGCAFIVIVTTFWTSGLALIVDAILSVWVAFIVTTTGAWIGLIASILN